MLSLLLSWSMGKEEEEISIWMSAIDRCNLECCSFVENMSSDSTFLSREHHQQRCTGGSKTIKEIELTRLETLQLNLPDWPESWPGQERTSLSRGWRRGRRSVHVPLLVSTRGGPGPAVLPAPVPEGHLAAEQQQLFFISSLACRCFPW